MVNGHHHIVICRILIIINLYCYFVIMHALDSIGKSQYHYSGILFVF
uniref:Uncharacterized protein n=1 Tax=Rhizophora mucronata TaxID=61149 RepID=A0A2P2IJC0_RHIMU